MEISNKVDEQKIEEYRIDEHRIGRQKADSRNLFWAFFILGFLILTSLVYAGVNIYYMYVVVYMWFGLAYGMMLQYGRFCFASASRDLFAAGVPRMAVGIMVALVFFSLIQAVLHATNMSTFEPAPFGVHMIIAGLIFGVGMVLAGGCASGSLYKIGEGNGTSLLALAGISFGQAIFVILGGPLNALLPKAWLESAATKGLPASKISSWYDVYLTGYIWNKPTIQVSKTSFIANTFPGAAKYFVGDAFLNVILPASLIIILIYVFWIRKGHIKKVVKAKGSADFHDELRGVWGMLVASKRTTLMGVLIGITAGLHILVLSGMRHKFAIANFGQLLTRMGHTGEVALRGTVFDPGYWYITTQEAQLAAWLMEKLGIDMHSNVFFGVVNGIPEPWHNPALWMSIGIILGAAVIALLNREFKWKWPKGELIAFGLTGGLLMGVGSRPSLGCNIGAFFVRTAGGDPNGWLYFTGMAAGAFLGVKFLNWFTERKMEKAMRAFDI